VPFWFVVDTAISIASKVGFNIVFNSALPIAIGLRLIFRRREFKANRVTG